MTRRPRASSSSNLGRSPAPSLSRPARTGISKFGTSIISPSRRWRTGCASSLRRSARGWLPDPNNSPRLTQHDSRPGKNSPVVPAAPPRHPRVPLSLRVPLLRVPPPSARQPRAGPPDKPRQAPPRLFPAVPSSACQCRALLQGGRPTRPRRRAMAAKPLNRAAPLLQTAAGRFK